MNVHLRQLVVVEPAAAQETVVHREAQRLDEMQARPDVRRKPDDVARVGRDLRVNEDDLHAANLTDAGARANPKGCSRAGGRRHFMYSEACSRSSILRILPVTVMGNSSMTRT